MPSELFTSSRKSDQTATGSCPWNVRMPGVFLFFSLFFFRQSHTYILIHIHVHVLLLMIIAGYPASLLRLHAAARGMRRVFGCLLLLLSFIYIILLSFFFFFFAYCIVHWHCQCHCCHWSCLFFIFYFLFNCNLLLLVRVICAAV